MEVRAGLLSYNKLIVSLDSLFMLRCGDFSWFINNYPVWVRDPSIFSSHAYSMPILNSRIRTVYDHNYNNENVNKETIWKWRTQYFLVTVVGLLILLPTPIYVTTAIFPLFLYFCDSYHSTHRSCRSRWWAWGRSAAGAWRGLPGATWRSVDTGAGSFRLLLRAPEEIFIIIDSRQ